MPSDKKTAVCCLLAVLTLQCPSIMCAFTLVQLGRYRLNAESVPLALLAFLAGIGLEAIGLLYILVPSREMECPGSVEDDNAGSIR